MNEVVDIVRYFRETTDDTASGTTRRMRRLMGVAEDLTWQKVLQSDSRPIVLLAPSGSGKTVELQQQVIRSRAAGARAFYAEASNVLDGLPVSLGQQEHSAFVEWEQGTEPAILFVDAVDELRRRQRNMHDMMHRLQRDVDLVARPLRLVLSARNGTWSGAATRELRMLTGHEPRLVTFTALDHVAIRVLAEASGVTDVDHFVRMFEDGELDTLFDLRPTDVRLLVKQWNKRKAFAAWTEMLDGYVSESFLEENLERMRAKSLPADRGRRGLERVAAATTFTGIPHLAVPTVAPINDTISSRRLFEDWSLAEVADLFENPLFVHKGSDAEVIQLLQGPTTYHLTARWLASRVAHGLPVEVVRDALMVRILDEQTYRIPTRYREVIGWAASMIPSFRAMLAPQFPEVVLYEGDPARLPDAEVMEALRLLCDTLSSQPDKAHEPWPSKGTLGRLARPSLEADVARLLSVHASSDLACRHLLRYVQAGCYSGCSDVARNIALKQDMSSETRRIAIRAVAASQSSTARAGLLPLLASTDEGIRVELLDALVPDLLKGAELVRFVTRGEGHRFRLAVRRVVERLQSSDLHLLIRNLLDRIDGMPRHNAADPAVQQFDIAVPLLLHELRCDGDVAPFAISLLARIERLSLYVHFHILEEDIAALDLHLAGDSATRRALWIERFKLEKVGPAGHTSVHAPAFGDAAVADVPWLLDVRGAHDEAVLVLRRIWLRLGPVERERALNGTSNDADRALLNKYLEDEVAASERQSVWHAEDEREVVEARRRNEERIRRDRAKIEAGEDFPTLRWAWEQLDHGTLDRRALDPVRLRRLVGDEYVDVLLRGMQACWRKQAVAYPIPGSNETSISALVGLVGIAIEARAGLQFPTLTESEARLAARYALHELNAFPFWFEDLLEAHPGSVTQVLVDALAMEWNFAGLNHGVIRFAARAEVRVAVVMRRVIVNLLDVGPPRHADTARYAVEALLTTLEERQRIASLTKREIERPDAVARTEWIRLWAHLEPEATAVWLARWTQRDKSREGTLLEVLRRLEQDFDDRGQQARPSLFVGPQALAAWIRLVLPRVPSKSEVVRQGVQEWGPRDDLKQFRNRLLGRIASDPTPEADAALRELRVEPTLASYQEIFERLSEQQRAASADAAAAPWTEENVLQVECGDERRPSSLEDMFGLLRSHLAHLARLIENDEFSYRGLFSRRTAEREIQLWTASCLRERTRGLYSVVREPVVDDNKEVDISAFCPGVGSIPIEIKPLGPYSLAALERVIEEQLIGKYMRPHDIRIGVLLLVRRERTGWQIQGKRRTFAQLIDHVRRSANAMGLRHGKVVHVATIDLRAAQASK